MNPGTITDSKGSSLTLARQVPGWGYTIVLRQTDGSEAAFEASPEQLGKLGAAFLEAASTPGRMAGAQALKAIDRAKGGPSTAT